MTNTHDTICAISTAQGGAIGMIRVSGPDAITATDKIFKPVRNIKLADAKPYTLLYGNIIDENSSVLDEVMVSVFHAPHSYTGENSAEITCHGSAYILQRVIELLAKEGCRIARPGEYTQRAFLNGKMDLSQAEAVADLIASNSRAAHRLALKQMRGGYSDELARLRGKLLDFTSLVELELDFADHEELEFADRSQLQSLAQEIEEKIARLCDSFSVGNAIKNGIPVAIVGRTNAGKSTLLNALVGEEKAIVSDIHGTTRDVIEDCISIDGILFRFFDTAGLRETTDTIESLGIARSYRAIDKAQIVLWVIDATELNDVSLDEISVPDDKQLIIVLNKIDKIGNRSIAEDATNPSSSDPATIPATAKVTTSRTQGPKRRICRISAKQGLGIDQLRQMLIEASQIDEQAFEDVTVSNSRHYENLLHALDAIRRVQDGLSIGLSGDLLSMDLRECIDQLGAITGGALATDEILGNIFSKFCIGK